MTDPRSIGDMELNAYVDGELESSGCAEVEAWLAAHPDDSARVAALRSHKEALAQLSAEVLREPVPSQLLQAVRTRRRGTRGWVRVAAALALFAVGGSAGWLTRDLVPDIGVAAAERSFVQHAIGAHAVYSREGRHPVEVWADKEEQHLVTWLSRRLGHTMKPPKLAEAGFKLVGGRLVAEDGGPAALYMYEDGNKRRITLYVRQAKRSHATAFRFAEDRALVAFYWIDGPLAFALIGQMPREELLSLARSVHRGLSG